MAHPLPRPAPQPVPEPPADPVLRQPLEMIQHWLSYLRAHERQPDDGPLTGLADAMDDYLRRCVPASPPGVKLRSRF